MITIISYGAPIIVGLCLIGLMFGLVGFIKMMFDFMVLMFKKG